MSTEQHLDPRYQVLRTIGSGGMGVVYLVLDTRKENKIMALKTLKATADPEAAESFRAEFRNIRGVRHPHIPEVYDFGTLPGNDNTLYFTCEFIDGKQLDMLSKQWNPAQLEVILVSLCRALAFLHSRSLLHRDIKPENVLGRLAENESFSLLKLVDFGLAQSQQTDTTGVAGTIDYMAPEIISGKPASVATDLYAVGMLLYRLATGRLPFEGDDPVALARTRTTTEAPPALRLRPDLPVGLSDVISSLIRLKPEDRPQSARHVIALLNEREGTDFAYETPETSRAYIHSATSGVHAEARERLHAIQREMLNGGDTTNLMILSQPGLGRTRLLQEFASELTLSGITVQTVRTERELSPDVARVLIIPELSELNPRAILTAINSPVGELCWWILGGREIPRELEQTVESFERIPLAPLTETGIKHYIASVFPENSFPENFAATLLARTTGFPSALQFIFDKLQEKELLRIGLNGWELLPGAWNFPVHHHVALAILSRYRELSPGARSLIDALASTLTPLPEPVLAAYLSRESVADPAHAKHELEYTGWVVANSSGVCLRFTAVAQAITDELTEERRTEIYRGLCEAWRAIPPGLSDSKGEIEFDTREREILYNDMKGRTWQTSLEDTQRILDHAFKQGYLEWVRKLLEWCLYNSPPDNLRNILLVQLSRVEYVEGNLAESSARLAELLNYGHAEITPANLPHFARYALLEEKLGRTESAEEILTRCLAVLGAEHSEHAGAIFGTLAWIAFKKGEQEKARELAEEGLVRVPAETVDAGYAQILNTVATLAFYRGVVDVAEVYWQRTLEINEVLGDQKGIANMYNNLGVLAAQSGDRIRARNLWEKCAEISRKISDSHRLAGIYNNLGIDSLETGAMREAEDYYLKSLALFRRMKSPREQVEALSNLGELAYYRADYPRAMAYFREAIDLSRMLGDRESQVEPMVYLGKLLVNLEQLEAAEPLLRQAQLLASEIGVKKGEGQAWEGLATLFARLGDAVHEKEALTNAGKLLSGDVDLLATVHLHLTECALAAERGDKDGVEKALARAREVAEIKWDPFTAARTQVYGLLFAEEDLDTQQRLLAQRKLAAYPDFQWKFHWAMARLHAGAGSMKKALDEFGRGVAILKAISARLSEEHRNLFLNSPQIRRFKQEAVVLRNSMEKA